MCKRLRGLALPLTHARSATQLSHTCPECVQGFEPSSWEGTQLALRDTLEGTAAREPWPGGRAGWSTSREEVRPETPPGCPSVELRGGGSCPCRGTQSGALTRSEPSVAHGK